ncbi:DgyrCDS9814 [Dimorphilus gyrociliatus]|uniref:Solute carrier organic anion transporter family member n=1 Tax=Dimorphilus gyrociliatus TaxID=2664684 RepID=A0A7I8VZI1_9ANNE|nr:DgyrCDS9814 [Dimorphilus gyrociliatus]
MDNDDRIQRIREAPILITISIDKRQKKFAKDSGEASNRTFSQSRRNSFKNALPTYPKPVDATASFERTLYRKVSLVTEVEYNLSNHNGNAQLKRDIGENFPCSFFGFLDLQFLNRFRSPIAVLTCLCIASGLQGFIVNGLIPVVLSSLEVRFGLSSTDSGIIPATYDTAVVVFLIPISYFGGVGHKPRWLGLGVLIMGLGAFLFSFPHFITSEYVDTDNSGTSPFSCNLNSTNLNDDCSKPFTSLNNFKYLFYFANFLHGVGAAPLFTLGVTYLDENLTVEKSSMYMGIFYSTSLLGPAIGYLLGGHFLSYHTDINRGINISNDINDPRWVGAWWIGFIIAGIICIIISLPIICFPKVLPGAVKIQQKRLDETTAGAKCSVVVCSSDSTRDFLKNVPKLIKDLLCNGPFVLLCLAGAADGFVLSGCGAFLPKFMENQFALTASWSAMLAGFIFVPCGGGGTFTGGFIVRFFELKCKSILKICLIFSGLATLTYFGILVDCDQEHVAGINYPYANHTSMKQLTVDCNRNCFCSDSHLDMVCDPLEQLNFVSPCYAGCSKVKDENTWINCSCVPSGAVKKGRCQNTCYFLKIFLPIIACLLFLTFITSIPALSGTLRCVVEETKSFALGIQWMIVRCLGTIPAPIILGNVFDSKCQYWKKDCGLKKNCFIYQNWGMARDLTIITLSTKFLTTLFFFGAFLLYRTDQSKRGIDDPPSVNDEDKSDSVMRRITPVESLDESKPMLRETAL